MLTQPLTMRASLTLTIVVMGVLGLGLALATGEVYRQQTLENQRTAMATMLRFKTDELLSELERKTRDLGLIMQLESEFQQAYAARDRQRLSRHWDGYFQRPLAAVNSVRIEKLRLYDANFSLFAESSQKARLSSVGKYACTNVLVTAGARQGADRREAISDLCMEGGKIYHAVIVPFGKSKPAGYIQIISDPMPSLKALEKSLGMPIKVTLTSGEVVYKSSTWLPPHSMGKALVASHELVPQGTDAILTVAILDDIHMLYEKLSKTRYMIMVVAGLATLLAIVIALLVLRDTTLLPLLALRDQLRAVRKDRSRLHETLTPAGTQEIRELSQDFNSLSIELGDLHRMLERLAFTDVLTDLPNRSHFHDRLHECTLAVRTTQPPFALFVMDLDRFKEVNDTFGHDVGDLLLRQVSTRLQGVLRRSDIFVRLDQETAIKLDSEIIARLGGDEFAAIVPRVIDEQVAIMIAQKFILVMQQPFFIGNHLINVGISVGVVLYPRHGLDPLTLMRQADVAMYQAKQGKSGYALFDSVRDHHKMQLLNFERDLRQAIENDELELYFQPLIELHGAHVRCVEALIRWPSRESDFASPEKLIHIAEQCGLIQPLTRWVLKRALSRCADWRQAGFPISVSVNLSAMNLHEPDIVDFIMETLERCQVEPSWLSLELTESALMSDPNHALEVLSRLDTMGVRISIDDFGTGYSSLAYLKRLPVDEIKVDRSFVVDITTDSNDAVIVRSIIDLAHNMSLQVIAEGVEDPAALALLKSLGCDLAQGFIVSEPLTYDDLLQWARDRQRGSLRVLRRPRPAAPH